MTERTLVRAQTQVRDQSVTLAKLSPDIQALLTREQVRIDFTPIADQTVLSDERFETLSPVNVYLNGVLLNGSEYTLGTGTLTLDVASLAGDQITVFLGIASSTALTQLYDTMNAAVTLSDFQDIDTASLLGRVSTGTGDLEILSVSAVKTLLGANAANGLCPLDASSKVPSANLPSYVDDVLDYADLAALPVTGESGKIYVTIDTSKTYRWAGAVYVAIDDLAAITPTSLGLVIGVNVQAYDAQLSSIIPQNSKSANYTTVATDSGKHLLHPAADTTARTFTLAANANVQYLVGTAISFINQNAGGVLTIAIAGTDVLRLAGPGTAGNRTLAANGVATAVKIATTEWLISGTGLT